MTAGADDDIGPPDPGGSRGGFNVGDVAGSVTLNAGGHIVAGNLTINEITKISAEAITQRPLRTAQPYRGLDRFEDRDRDFFFGRDQLIKALVAELGSGRLLLLLGASGSGKSSLIRAGLLPVLSGILGAPFRSFTLVPDRDPFLSVQSALLAQGFSQSATGALVRREKSLSDVLRGLRRPEEEWLLFVDQFEEVFTTAEESLRRPFLTALLDLVRDPAPCAKLVLAMRAEFLDDFGPYPEFAEAIAKRIALMADMRPDELRLAIEQPAARQGVVFDPGLVQEITDAVLGEPGSLPLLQYALRLLWDEQLRRDGLASRHLHTESYREIGGVLGALQMRADLIYVGLAEGQNPDVGRQRQDALRKVLLRLLDIASADDAHRLWRPGRRRVARDSFADPYEQEVFKRLIDEKLVVSDRTLVVSDGAHSQTTVEVAHESLFVSWNLLKSWIQEGKEVIFAANRLSDDAARWKRRMDANAKDADDELLAGARLAQALELRNRGEFDAIMGGLGATGKLFLQASAALRDKRQLEERARQEHDLAQEKALREAEARRATDAVRWSRRLAVAALGAGILAAVSLWYRGRARSEELRAKLLLAATLQEEGRDLVVGGHPMRAIPYLVAARAAGSEGTVLHMLFAETLGSIPLHTARAQSGVGAPPWGRSGVRFAAFDRQRPRVVLASDATAWAADVNTGRSLGPPLQHHGFVTSASFSPDSTRVATASEDNTAQIWDVATGAAIGPPLRHRGRVYSVCFSPDGERVVTASADGTAQLWNTSTGAPIGRPLQHADRVDSAAFSPDGARVVTASADGTARIWDGLTGEAMGPPLVHNAPVPVAAFSPEGRRVLTGAGPAAYIWDAESGERLGAPLLYEGDGSHVFVVTRAAFAPDGTRVLTADGYGTVRLWDATTGKLTATLEHQSPVLSEEFSPDGTRVVTTSLDSTVRVWDAKTAKPLTASLEHEGKDVAAAFSADGHNVVGVSDDGTLRTWELAKCIADTRSLVSSSPVTDVLFSSDGTKLLTRNANHAAEQWDLSSGRSTPRVLGTPGSVVAASFAAGGARVAVINQDDLVQLWDASTGKPVTPLLRHPGMIHDFLISADGERLVTLGFDHALRVWDMATGAVVAGPLVDETRMTLAVPNRDATLIASASEDGGTRIWDLTKDRPLVAQLGSDNETPVRFSPDGRLLITKSPSQVIHIWDIASGSPSISRVLKVPDLSFGATSRDGHYILTQTVDGNVQIWNPATGQPAGLPLLAAARIAAAEFSEDDTRVAVSTDDGVTRVWSVPAGRLLGPALRNTSN